MIESPADKVARLAAIVERLVQDKRLSDDVSAVDRHLQDARYYLRKAIWEWRDVTPWNPRTH